MIKWVGALACSAVLLASSAANAVVIATTTWNWEFTGASSLPVYAGGELVTSASPISPGGFSYQILSVSGQVCIFFAGCDAISSLMANPAFPGATYSADFDASYNNILYFPGTPTFFDNNGMAFVTANFGSWRLYDDPLVDPLQSAEFGFTVEGFTTVTPQISAVPGPIAGAGLPGLAAFGVFMSWRRRRKLALAA